MSFDWDEGPVSEYEILSDSLEEFDSEAEYEYEDEYEDIAEELIESVNESSAFELNQHEASSIYNARLRLEQARLYELLINHNVFDGVESSPEAIAKVQEDLKKYLVDRLEILLGIKKKKKKEVDLSQVVVDSQFNDVEVDFLKALAYKGTKGESRNGVAVRQSPRLNAIKPIQAPVAISKPKPIIKPIPEPARRPVKEFIQKAEPLKPTKKKKKQVKKKTNKKKKLTFKTGIKERNLTQDEINAIALAEIKEERALMGGRDAHTLSANDKEELMRKRSEKHFLPRPAAALPPPTENEEYTFASNHTNNITSVGKLGDLISSSMSAPIKGE